MNHSSNQEPIDNPYPVGERATAIVGRLVRFVLTPISVAVARCLDTYEGHQKELNQPIVNKQADRQHPTA